MRIAEEKAISITMEELEKSRFDARKPSIGNRSRAHELAPISLSAILVDHPLPTRAMLFISDRFHERVPRTRFARESIRGLLCALPCLYRQVARYSRMDPAASASANTGLSSRAIHLHARGEIISVTSNTPAAAGKFLAPT